MKQHTFSLFMTLTAFWLLNSGHYNTLILLLGAASIALVLVISHKMDVVDQESQPFYLTPNILGYYLWLIKEIMLSTITVTKHIWLGKNSLSPCIRKVKIGQNTDMGKVIYANSLTLIPGTVAVDLVDDEILVHALLYKDLESLMAGEMDRRVRLLES